MVRGLFGLPCARLEHHLLSLILILIAVPWNFFFLMMDSSTKSLCDDNDVDAERALNVDYLSHVWREDDIWVTRRYVLRQKRALKKQR